MDYAARLNRLRDHLTAAGIDAALIGLGPDLEYFTGYRAHPLERLTMLIVTRRAPATLVLPVLEAAHFAPIKDAVVARTWQETEDPIAIVVGLLGDAASAAVSDETWARFLIDLQHTRPDLRFERASSFTGPLRMRKESVEVEALRAVGACVDEVMAAIQLGEVELVGRTEREIAHEVSARLLDAGHDTVEFCIVASGPNAASPHHEPTTRVVQPDEVVLFDIGGRRQGYSSDCTRCVVPGKPPPGMTDAYAVLQEAQRAGVAASRVGATCQDVDRVVRQIIDEAGYGEAFIHRTGHGIGLAGHEEPYIVEGNSLPLEPGFAFSVEPGIYRPGKWGLRIEDIVVVTDGDPLLCNLTPTDLVCL